MMKTLLAAAALALTTALAATALTFGPANAKIDASQSPNAPKTAVKAPERNILAQRSCRCVQHDYKWHCIRYECR